MSAGLGDQDRLQSRRRQTLSPGQADFFHRVGEARPFAGLALTARPRFQRLADREEAMAFGVRNGRFHGAAEWRQAVVWVSYAGCNGSGCSSRPSDAIRRDWKLQEIWPASG